MKYVGMQTQIWRNNRNTTLLLCMYPFIVVAMVFAFIFLTDYFGVYCAYFKNVSIDGKLIREACFESGKLYGFHWPVVQFVFLKALPWTIIVIVIWFLISYCFNVHIIRHVTRARPLERKENVRVYNIVENLCIAGGIEMPQINIIEDQGLNAFASGIDISTFTITFTSGIINALNDEELSAVAAHELAHIKNRDTRLMVVCIVFVGLISILQTICIGILKGAIGTSSRKSKKNAGGIFVVLFLAVVGISVTTIAYFFSYINRLAISRKREYVADAGAAELCGNPLALSAALQKISANPGLSNVKRQDVAQLYIIHPDEEESASLLRGLIAKIDNIFRTHPETKERIRLLEQF